MIFLLILISLVISNTTCINWNGNNWALGCDFIENNLKNEQISGEQCGGRCAVTSGCTHWSWTTYNGGTCWMKTGSVSKSDAKATGDNSMSCGVVDGNDSGSNSGSSVNWNGNNWALGCDFIENNLKNEQISGEQCGGRCAVTSGCTHWSWTTYNGGTCWMKTGSVSKSDAKATGDNSMSCGVVDGNDSGSNSGSSVNWNGNNWALGCDFIENNLKNEQISGEQCGGRCAVTSGCTHWSWTTYNGGTCWMKTGSVSKSDAKATGDNSMSCGVVDGNDSGDTNGGNNNNWSITIPRFTTPQPQANLGNALKPLSDYIKKYGKTTFYLAKQGDLYYLYGSSGVEITDDIYATINIGAEVSVIKYIKSTGSNMETVDFSVLKARAGIKLGSANGFECYATIIEGKVSVFDFKLGVAADTIIGINKDSYTETIFGTGFFYGRRIGVSLFGSSFGIDFRRFFSDKQWETIKPFVQASLMFASFPMGPASALGELFGSTLGGGRRIAMTIDNYTFWRFIFVDSYFDTGKMDRDPSDSITRGYNTGFTVEKKFGFYGVEGVVVYKVDEINKDFVFFFSNPYTGGNKIVCKVFESGSDAKALYKSSKSSKKSSDEVHTDNDEDSDFRLIYTISSGDQAMGAFRVISKKLILD